MHNVRSFYRISYGKDNLFYVMKLCNFIHKIYLILVVRQTEHTPPFLDHFFQGDIGEYLSYVWKAIQWSMFAHNKNSVQRCHKYKYIKTIIRKKILYNKKEE